MDRYVLARTKDLTETVAAQMDGYDITSACATIRDFLDVLTNWYLRTSRQRFTDGDKTAFDTLAKPCWKPSLAAHAPARVNPSTPAGRGMPASTAATGAAGNWVTPRLPPPTPATSCWVPCRCRTTS